jgi:hypothetical protein
MESLFGGSDEGSLLFARDTSLSNVSIIALNHFQLSTV